MSVFACFVEIGGYSQYMVADESKDNMLEMLYHEVHENHGMDVEVSNIFIVEGNETAFEVEKEVCDYFESCRLHYLISLGDE